MRPFHVSVHLIEPGIHRTNINYIDDARIRAIRKVYDGLPQDIKDDYGEIT